MIGFHPKIRSHGRVFECDGEYKAFLAAGGDDIELDDTDDTPPPVGFAEDEETADMADPDEAHVDEQHS